VYRYSIRNEHFISHKVRINESIHTYFIYVEFNSQLYWIQLLSRRVNRVVSWIAILYVIQHETIQKKKEISTIAVCIYLIMNIS